MYKGRREKRCGTEGCLACGTSPWGGPPLLSQRIGEDGLKE
jgi:hypothetical protein